MFTTNYYCLVAGLKEYSLDADTKGFDAKAIVGEILEGVDGADADAVRLLYGYYDCENIASLRAGRSAHNPLGNFTREELAEELKLSPADTVVHALDCCGGRVACIYFSIDEGDMLNIMKDMDIAVGSDGYGLSFDRSITITDPHPRSFGTFPRFLELARDHRLMPLEDAVYKLTGLPADILGLRDRGTLAEGRIADITVFDAERVRDTSEFTDSVRKPEGICHVLVGGEFALRQGRSAGGRKGAVIRRESGGPV